MDFAADLSTLANLAEILGASTIIGGALFATFQIREFRAQRREAVAVELMRSFSAPDLAHAFNLIRELPDGITADDLRAGARVRTRGDHDHDQLRDERILVFRG